LNYSSKIEPIPYGNDESNLKQVEAKILDFNWTFIAENAARLTHGELLAPSFAFGDFASASVLCRGTGIVR